MKLLFTYLLILVTTSNAFTQKQFVDKTYQLNKKDCIVGFIPSNDSILIKSLWNFIDNDGSNNTLAFDIRECYTNIHSEKECNTRAVSFLDWIESEGKNSYSLKQKFSDKELHEFKICLGADILIFPSSISNETIVKQNGHTTLKSSGHFRLIDLNSGDIFLSKKVKATTHVKGTKEDWGPNGDRVEIRLRNWRLACSAVVENFSSVYQKEFINRNKLS